MLLKRLVWQRARLLSVAEETPRVKSLTFAVPTWGGHLAGQHVDIRLTAEDGYQAERSYSIASPPESPNLTLTVERLDDGEVSPYLADVLQTGDDLELRGPIGRYFIWEAQTGGPLLLVAGGSGIVPLAAMLRHRAAQHSTAAARLLYSARAFDEIIYRAELDGLAADRALTITYTLTRSQPSGWAGYARRVDREMLTEVAWPPAEQPLIYVCGPTAFVEGVATTLVELGHAPQRIKTERFGSTGSPVA